MGRIPMTHKPIMEILTAGSFEANRHPPGGAPARNERRPGLVERVAVIVAAIVKATSSQPFLGPGSRSRYQADPLIPHRNGDV